MLKLKLKRRKETLFGHFTKTLLGNQTKRKSKKLSKIASF